MESSLAPKRPLPRLRGRDREGARNKTRASSTPPPPPPPPPPPRPDATQGWGAGTAARNKTRASSPPPQPSPASGGRSTLSLWRVATLTIHSTGESPMAAVLALCEDVLADGAALALSAAARMIFLVHGGATVAGRALRGGEAWHGDG